MENDFEELKAALLLKHTRLLSQNADANEMQKFWADVNDLPDEHRAEIIALTQVARVLKNNKNKDLRSR